MKVSYIITTFNRHNLLERAVGYVARERCSDSELIVVDDNSRPPVKMPDLASEAFPGANHLIRNRQNLGVIGARNAGISAAKGEYLIFLDDDDESLPGRTKDLLSQIEDTGFDFVAARSHMETSTNVKVVPAKGGFLLTPEKLLLYPSHINAIIWRRKIFAAGLDNRVPYLGEHISLVLCLVHGGRGWLSEALVARFAYIDAGLTKKSQQRNLIGNHLIHMYRILLEEDLTPSFRRLCDKVLQMLQHETILDFDDYLNRLKSLTEE